MGSIENTHCDRCVASDVEVVESEAGQTERQCRGEGGGKPVRVAPVHVLIPGPVHQGVAGRPCQRETRDSKSSLIQECIPVGCVPSATVAVCGGGVCPGGVCPGVSAWEWGVYPGGVCSEGVSAWGLPVNIEFKRRALGSIHT